MVESIQGKGVHVPDNAYLPAAMRLCRKHKTIFIVDEVQTGYGRTGRMFACERNGVEPDILITTKALSGGYVPAGAVLSRRWIHEKVFSSLDRCLVHSTTFGQNDLAMAAGLATLHVLREHGIVENAAAVGEQLKTRLAALVDKYEMVHEVRGKGLMLAIEFAAPRSLTLKVGWSLLHKLDAGLFPPGDPDPAANRSSHPRPGFRPPPKRDQADPAPVLSATDADSIADAFDHVIAACHKFPGPIWEVGKRLAQQSRKPQPSGVR